MDSPLRYYDLMGNVTKDIEMMNKDQLEAVTEVLLCISQYCEKKYFTEQVLETKPLVKTLEEISEIALETYIGKFGKNSMLKTVPPETSEKPVSQGVDYII